MEKSKNIKTTVVLPVSIIIGSFIIGGFVYAAQLSKQRFIESQEKVKQEEQKLKDEISSKQRECELLSKGVMEQWNNVMGVFYDEILWKECVVTYTDTETGEVLTSPLSLMKTINN